MPTRCREITGRGQEADKEKVLPEGNEDWRQRMLKFQWMLDGRSIAKRMGVDKVADVANIAMTKIQGAALKRAFLLVWTEVLVGDGVEENFMTRWKGDGLSREISFLFVRRIGRKVRRLDPFGLIVV